MRKWRGRVEWGRRRGRDRKGEEGEVRKGEGGDGEERNGKGGNRGICRLWRGDRGDRKGSGGKKIGEGTR